MWETTFYGRRFDDTKTDAGRRSLRSIPRNLGGGYGQPGGGRSHRKPDDFIFTQRKRKPRERRKLLRRISTPQSKKLALPSTVDFRSHYQVHARKQLEGQVHPKWVS